MKVTRKEIMPCVFLTCLETTKFKTGCLSISLLTQLSREDAAKNALIPRVLRRGSTQHPDMEAISAALDELYGARIEPVVRKKGEIQAVGFFADFVDEAFLPGGERLLEKVTELMTELLLSPCTRGGLLLPAYVDSEKDKLLEQIKSKLNDKRSYSVQRLIELMCFGENYAVDRDGDEEGCRSINYQKLTKHYKELLASSPVEIFYAGTAGPIRVEKALNDALINLPRGEINTEIGTDIRMNSVEESPRYFSDSLDVTQGKLAIGFRLGDSMLEPDLAALRVFNAVYGGSVTSKLFMNVREKLSLCYYASSMLDWHKGIMVVSSGVEFDKYGAARDEIFRQLDSVRDSDITEDELTAAKRYVSATLRASMDSPTSLEDFYLSAAIEGLEFGPEELAALTESVTMEQVVAVAGTVECDAVYFLKGLEEE